MISLTFLWKNGTNIANGKFKFGELRKSEFIECFCDLQLLVDRFTA